MIALAAYGCGEYHMPPESTNLIMSNFEPGTVADFGFNIIYKCKEGYLFKEDVNLVDQRYLIGAAIKRISCCLF